MTSRVIDELQCPTCLEIFQDPVVLLCSHSFCRACVQQWWEQKGDRTCPLCRTECNSMLAPPNLALRNVCETFSKLSVESEDTCRLHGEKLKLFCLDHQELACIICMAAEIHAGHKFRPLDEVVETNKENLREVLQGAKRRLKDFNEARDNSNEQATSIKVQRDQIESKIKKDFEALHGFLRFEEEARLAAVRREEEEKTCMLKEKIEALGRDMVALSDAIRSTEDLLISKPIFFMNNFQTAITGMQNLPDKPELLSEAFLDEVKHVGNLNFSVWERMKGMASYSPTALDPDMTGNRFLQAARFSATIEEKQNMMEKLKAFNRDINNLSETIRSSKKLPLSDPASFWKKLQTKIPMHRILSEPVLYQAEDLDDQVKATGSNCPTVLDPNIANPKFNLRDELARMFRKDNSVQSQSGSKLFVPRPRSNSNT